MTLIDTPWETDIERIFDAWNAKLLSNREAAEEVFRIGEAEDMADAERVVREWAEEERYARDEEDAQRRRDAYEGFDD